jgi:cell division protein FtsW
MSVPLKKSNPDLILIIVTLSLLTVGLIMVYSASAIWATYKFDDSFYFAKRQLLFACVGVIAMFFIMNVDYWTWRTWAKILIIICFIMLLAVLVPGIGMARNGSRSWIGVGAFSVQPSEFMKLAMIAFLAKFLSERQKLITSFKKGMLPSLGLVFLAFGLIMLQPDLGTGTVMVGTSDFVSTLPDKKDHVFSGSMGRPFGQWISDDSIVLCNRARGIVRIGTRAKPPKVFLFTRTAD